MLHSMQHVFSNLMENPQLLTALAAVVTAVTGFLVWLWGPWKWFFERKDRREALERSQRIAGRRMRMMLKGHSIREARRRDEDPSMG